jgi:protein ImuB
MRTAGALRLAAIDAAAQARGLEPGLGLAQAQAIAPDLVVRPHEAEADARLLAQLADWADRYTPLVALVPPDGLTLDLTGAAHLLGGEAALVADATVRLRRHGLTVASAVAGTPGAAWGLARYARGTDRSARHVADADLDAVLARLPVAALRLPAETVAGLGRSGLSRIGDLVERPRAPLAARFGPLLLQRLDQARGIDAEAIGPRRPVPPAVVERRLAEPIVRQEDVGAVARALADALCAQLAERDQGVRGAQLLVFRVDGAVRRIEVGLAGPCRDGKTLHGLLALRLHHLEDPLDPGYGFDLIRLAATAIGPCGAQVQALPSLDPAAADRVARQQQVIRLGDRLAARFGDQRVMRPQVVDSHLPEHAGRLVPIRREAAPPRQGNLAGLDPPAAGTSIGPLRPLRLFEPPEPVEIVAGVPDGPPLRLRWRRQSLRVTAAEGPERLSAPWWVGAGARAGARPETPPRDYYRVVDEGGRRLWIFRDAPYDATHPPRWFVHGLFA